MANLLDLSMDTLDPRVTLPPVLPVEALETEDSPSLEEQLKTLQTNTDVFFLIFISCIVFFMQAGFAFLEVGSVRSKNATNILIKNMLDVFIGGIAYWLIGYSIAYGEGGNGFIGTTYWAGVGLPHIELANWVFQFVFAATAATIVSGSVAERCAFSAYFIYSILLTGFVYPVVSHWTWSDNGWLAQTAYQDFAGSGVVHMTGGVAALVGAIMLGPRIGRFNKDVPDLKGHSVPLAALGGFILLFAFLAFNGGSQGSISSKGDAEAVARAIVNTIIAGSSGGLVVLIIIRLRGAHTWSFLLTLNGALCGMVSICAGCNVQYIWGALITGGVGGVVFLLIHYILIALKIDDPLDAVGVHFGGGCWGLIAVALFAENGLALGNAEGLEILKWNLVGMATIIAWSGGLSLFMFGILRVFKQLRVPEDVEIKGLDIIKHGEPAYPADAWYEDQYHKKNHEGEFKPGRRNSHIPANMSVQPRIMEEATELPCGLYPQFPHMNLCYMNEMMHHSLPAEASKKSKKRSKKKAMVNHGFEMDKL